MKNTHSNSETNFSDSANNTERRNLLKSLFVLASSGLFAIDLEASSDPKLALMHGKNYQPSQSIDGFWISEKLDGVRARWDGKQLWSRSGLPINPPKDFTQNWPKMALDGELWAGRGRFSQAVSAVQTGDLALWQNMRFMVFDAPDVSTPFSNHAQTGRLQVFTQAILEAKSSTLQAIEHQRASTKQALDDQLKQVIKAGGEGLMLHHEDHLYQAGRSNGLLKYKPFDDEEAQVIAILPGKGKFENMMGALLVKTQQGHRLRLGTGFTNEERQNPPAIGDWVIFRYQGTFESGVPRFARFLRVKEQTP